MSGLQRWRDGEELGDNIVITSTGFMDHLTEEEKKNFQHGFFYDGSQRTATAHSGG